MMAYEDGVAKIPSAALSVEDVGLIARLSKRGPVTLHLLLTPQTLPDVTSHNVVVELTGSQKPNEVVLVSGHLDSWDLATGAIDDGAGVMTAMGALHVLNELKLRPKRSLRAVAFMSEEVGAVGGRAYFEAHRAELANYRAVVETDFGAGKPLGFEAYVLPESIAALRSLQDALAPIGATYLRRSERPVAADIAIWQAAGVPGFETQLDARHYFDFHHTQADTLDKVEPQNLARMVASVGVLAYYLADCAEPPAHLPALAQP
jgi:Zn-dependent M28 family amino/carboxypeptidase